MYIARTLYTPVFSYVMTVQEVYLPGLVCYGSGVMLIRYGCCFMPCHAYCAENYTVHVYVAISYVHWDALMCMCVC